MNKTIIAPTENDVVLGRQGFRSTHGTMGNKRLWEILKENYEAHDNADWVGRHNLEMAFIEQVKKELPLARFLRFYPADGSSELAHYRVIEDDEEVRKTLSRAITQLRYYQKQKEKRNTSKTHSKDLPSPGAASQNVVFVRTTKSPAANSTQRLFHQPGTNGWKNHYSLEQAINQAFLIARRRFNYLKALSSIQVPPQQANFTHEHNRVHAIVNAKATQVNTIASNKRPSETTTVESRKRARRMQSAANASEIVVSNEKAVGILHKDIATLLGEKRKEKAIITSLVYQKCRMEETIVALERRVAGLQYLLWEETQTRIQRLRRFRLASNSSFPFSFPHY